MARWQKIALAVLALVMLVVALLTWGSIGSIVMVLGLLTIPAALLMQHVLNRDDPYHYE